MRQRIQTLDGLRFLAAIGVLWIHAWTFFGNPRYYIGPIDIAAILAIGGNGVDLFFVISGFCMYYFYASKNEFSYHDFYRFIIKRWVRLSPAFYAIAIVYIIIANHDIAVDMIYLLNSVFYLNAIFPQYNIASHFWTLGVEWQFYLIIPFLLIYQNKIGFKKIFIGVFGIVFFIGVISVFIFKDQYDWFTNFIFFRGIEFGCGVIAARLLIKSNSYLKSRILWLLMFLAITYVGRAFISRQVLALSPYYYNLYKLLGFIIMGGGFAGILYLAVTSVKWLNLILGNKLFKKMGKISYSFYLWHALVFPIIAGYIIRFLPISKGIMLPVITTIISTIVLYPVSQLSYNLLEKPFLSVGNLTTK
ncbi:MAG: hypothetical protein JWP44_3649 [Mucilaginibacter sp.]|nr:hypothetical protein [Mucilaginibacter sp.]